MDTWCLILFLLLAYKLTDPVCCDPVDDVKIREKRNIICRFGLTDVVKEALYGTLEETRTRDSVALDDAWKGQLHDGVLKGLSTLTNATDLEVFCDEHGIMIFVTTLRMNDVEVWYKWTRKVLFKFKGSVWMKAKEVDFDLEVRLNTTGGLKFEVTNSVITKVDEFQIGFKGLGPLNPVVRKIMKKVWKDKAAAKIGLLLKEALEKKLTRVGRSLEWIPFWY